MKKITYFLILLVASLGFVACRSAQDAELQDSGELTHIRLPMGYIPSVQYAPFYSADEADFFKEEGIEIEYDYSFETDGVALVASNELQFALVSGEQVVLARAEGLPVVYVFSWYSDYPIAVVSKSEKGITRPEDLRGKHIGIPGLFGASYVGFRALLDSVGLAEGDVTLESIGFNQVEAIAADQVDAAVVYVNNEPYQLQDLGYDVNVIHVADYAQLASNGLITNEITIKENPELVQRMVTAVRRGIKFTVTHPAEAYAYCEEHVEGLEIPAEHIRQAEMERFTDLYQTEPYGFSFMETWENMQAVLIKMGFLTESIDLKAAFTNEFVE